MACFIVPMVQALATTAYRRHKAASIESGGVLKHEIPTLEKMLWGGTVMLIVDHVVNGELTWRYPFFSALGRTGGFEVMLKEMLTVGVPMSITLTLVWAVYAILKYRRKAITKTT